MSNAVSESDSGDSDAVRSTPAAIAAQLVYDDQGILASDESVPTIGKRLEKAGLVNDERTRQAYRDIFYGVGVPGVPRYKGPRKSGPAGWRPPREPNGIGGVGISGAILFKEALDQRCVTGKRKGMPFVDSLRRQHVLVGVKVDSGLEPLQAPGALPLETQTRGLAELPELVREVAAKGAEFAKFRCALRMAPGSSGGASTGPSEAAIDVNARQLAEYAAICQAGGGDLQGSALCPIVEPELLIDGAHNAAAFEAASARVMSSTIAALWRQPGVSLEGLLIKPQMVVPGSEWKPPPGTSAGLGLGGLPIAPDEVAERTLRVMRATVPPAVPGIMFLSGGQTERQATQNLAYLNQLAGNHASNSSSSSKPLGPWALSFSFGRALQASVLKCWVDNGGGKRVDVKEEHEDKRVKKEEEDGGGGVTGVAAGEDDMSSDERAELAAQKARVVAMALADANRQAVRGWPLEGDHPSLFKPEEGGLHETYRGHY
jgi:fructose-bisphosphate aldolase class I